MPCPSRWLRGTLGHLANGVTRVKDQGVQVKRRKPNLFQLPHGELAKQSPFLNA